MCTPLGAEVLGVAVETNCIAIKTKLSRMRVSFASLCMILCPLRADTNLLTGIFEFVVRFFACSLDQMSSEGCGCRGDVK